MEGRLVALKGQRAEALADDLTAIPGVPVEVHGMSWALRVGPDRAESVRRVAHHHGVEMSDAARRGIAELCARRELSEPVLELVTREGLWLSLMDDWLSLAVEELRAVPGSRPRPAAGRIEVPLTRWTAEPIRCTLASHRLRLSPAAELAMREIVADPEAPEEDAGEEHPGAHVSMDAGGLLVLAAPPRDDLARVFASLPQARLCASGAVAGWRR